LSLIIGTGPSLRYCRKLFFALMLVTFAGNNCVFAIEPEQASAQANAPATEQSSSLKVKEAQPARPGKIVLKPGEPMTIGMQAEDICVTDDVNVAKAQVAEFPDSPDASFILAVCLTRTSMVEQALSEVRRARKLAEKEGGPVYFDKMIKVYEDMLKDYPDDNRLRYGLAWAYYMKAYVLAKYSKGFSQAPVAAAPAAGPAPVPSAATAQPAANTATISVATTPGQDAAINPTATPPAPTASKDWRPVWVSALTTSAPGLGLWGEPGKTTSQSTLPYLKGALEQAPPAVVPQIKLYYETALSNLDELLRRDPNDVWALVYRAFLNAEYTGNLKESMEVWRACQIKYPDNPAPYFFLGEGYLKEGNLKESLQNISRAVALRAIGK